MSDWTDDELKAVVDAYLSMLNEEKSGRPYNKAEVNARLRKGPLSSRTKGSVEYRMQNISSVMVDLGKKTIKGYLPAKNTGTEIKRKIAALLLAHPSVKRAEISGGGETDVNASHDEVIAAFLYYWADYEDDRTKQNDFLHLNQNSPVMAEITPGATVWAISRVGKGHYVLIARLLVASVGENKPHSEAAKRGNYFLKADSQRSIFFDPEHQPNMEQIIRSLSVKAQAKYLGQSFQGNSGVRALTKDDHKILEENAYETPTEDNMTTAEALSWWNYEQPSQLMDASEIATQPPSRREYIREVIARNRKHVKELKELYKGVCQVTGEKVMTDVTEDLTEVHHIEWLTDGGLDTKDNMLVVSPNVHAAIHATRGTIKWRDDTPVLVIGNKEVKLAVNKHLKPK
jgi:hypothetical protein